MTKQNTRRIGVTVTLFAALAMIVCALMFFGVAPARADGEQRAAGESKVLYLVDAGYMVNSNGDLVGRNSNDGTPQSTSKASALYGTDFKDDSGNITGLYNTVADQPFTETSTPNAEGKNWGYIGTTGASSSESQGGGQGSRWCTANTGETNGSTTTRLVEGKFRGTLTYKFQIPASDAVTGSASNYFNVSLGAMHHVENGWNTSSTYSVKVNGKDAVEANPSTTVAFTHTFNNVVAEKNDTTGEYYISVIVDSGNSDKNLFINWIKIVTSDAETIIIYGKSIAKGDNVLKTKLEAPDGTTTESTVALSEASIRALNEAEIFTTTTLTKSGLPDKVYSTGFNTINLTLENGATVNDVLVLPQDTVHFINVNGSGDNAYMIGDGEYSDARGSGYKTGSSIGSCYGSGGYATTLRDSGDPFEYRFKVESGKSYGVIVGSYGNGWGSREIGISVGTDGTTYGQLLDIIRISNGNDGYYNNQNTPFNTTVFNDSTATDLYVRLNKQPENASQKPGVTYFLIYEVNKATLDYQGHGGTNGPEYFQGTYTLPTLSETGYTFGGWFSDAACTEGNQITEFTQSGTAYAKWTQDTYTITYNPGENAANSSSNPATYHYGDEIALGAPTKTVTGERWRFDGWYSSENFAEGTKVTAIAATDSGNKTLYAKWVQQFTVSFDLNDNGECGVSAPTAEVVDKDAQATAPDMTGITRDGYSFVGWTTDQLGNSPFAFATTPVTADITLYAKWASLADIVTVTYYTNDVEGGGTVFTTANIAKDSAITNFPDSDPTRTGYDFAGWYEDIGCTGEAVTTAKVVTANLSLYAKWTLKKYTVSFNTGCEATVPDQEVGHGSKASEPTGLVNGSKVLMGWYTDSTFARKFDFADDNDAITADITLYARWATVKFGGFLNQGATSITAVADDKTGEYFEIPLSDGDVAKVADAEYWSTVTLNVSYNGTDVGSATVTVIPKSTKYFVNFGEFPGAGEWSQPQDNPVPNGYRAYTEGLGYGFTEIKDLSSSSKKPEVAAGQGDGTYKETILLNFEKLTYRFDDLEVGKYYKVVLGHYNPWQARPIIVTTTGAGEGALRDKSCNIDGGYSETTFTVKMSETTLSITMAKASNKDHPMISFLYIYEVGKAAYNINYDGAEDEAVWLEMGEEYALPTDVSRNGYTLTGWNTQADGNGEDITSGKVAAGQTAYAKWELTVYTITYVLPKGAQCVFDEETVADSTTTTNANYKKYKMGAVFTLVAPTLDGYNFVGWESEALGKVTGIAADTAGDLVLTAVFIKANTVTFDVNGGAGTGLDQQTVETGNTVTEPPVPTKEGYTFGGWYTDNGTWKQPFDFGKALEDGDIALYAYWRDFYIVTLAVNGGNEMEAIEVKLNAADKKIAPADAERNGYTFVGWYKDKGLETAFDKENDLIDADTTLYAKWTIKTYTVTFNTNGGSAVAAETVIFDKRVQKPDAPTKDGASFEGWYKDSALTEEYDFVNDRISEDTTIYAKWGTLTYAVSFVTNGGSPITTLRVPARSDFKTVLADVVTTKPGYKFSGWYTDEALIEKLEYEKPQNVAIVEADTVLYAYWRPSPYTVIFMDRDTEFSKQGVYYPNKVIDPGYPEEREGYVFVGWCSDEALTRAFDFDTLVTEDTTVYAKWKEVVYTLTFNAAGGSAVDPVVDLKKGVAVTMPTDPVKEGYTFGGWYTDKGCTKLFDPTKGVKKNTVLYAKWEAPETETVDEGISGGAIAGIVITIVLMAAAIAAVSIFLVKKKIIR